jgi:uncharacterized protein YjbI with pentapeptide repeats
METRPQTWLDQLALIRPSYWLGIDEWKQALAIDLAVGGVFAVLLVGALPFLFSDEVAARGVIAASLLGLISIGLAIGVLARLAGEAAEPAPRPHFPGARLTGDELTRLTELIEQAPSPFAFEVRAIEGEEFRREAFDEGKIDEGPILVGVDLREATLPEEELQGADLTGALLEAADLRGAKLGRAKLDRADLRSGNLASADLRGATLTDADLREAQLEGAELAGADLRGAQLEGAELFGANLRGALVDDTTSWPADQPPPADLGAIDLGGLR